MEIFVHRPNTDSIEEGFPAEDLPALLADKSNVVWVDFDARTGAQVQEAKNILLEVFKFHHLTVEDCLETRNQPKVESFPHYLYFIVHGVKHETNSANFVTRELDGYLGDNFVVTFRTEEFRSIDEVKRQIRSTSYVCERGAAYLLHQILDQLVDLYMPVVDDFDNTINDLEERIFAMRKSSNLILEEIMDLRRSVARIKRITARQLNVLYPLSRGEFRQIPENLLPFYRDVHDHLLRIFGSSEGCRDPVNGTFQHSFFGDGEQNRWCDESPRGFLGDNAAAVGHRRNLRNEYAAARFGESEQFLACRRHDDCFRGGAFGLFLAQRLDF